jgi:hypothetical protein
MLLVGAMVAAFAGLAPVAVAGQGDPPGEITLPALFGNQLPTVNFFAATPSGAAWLLDEGDDRIGAASYTSYSGAQHTDANLGDTDVLTLSGSELTGERDGHLTSLDIDSGTSRPAACSPTYFVGNNEGCLTPDTIDSGPNAGPGVILNEGGQSQRFALPNPGGVHFGITVDSLDATGAVVTAVSFGAPDTSSNLVYLDFSTGETTVLADGDAATTDMSPMSPSAVAWNHGDDVDWLDRADPGTVHSLPVGSRVLEVALSGTNLGYTTAAPSGTQGFSIHTGALASTSFATVTSEYPGVSTGRAGNFLVTAGRTTTDFGAYALTSGATSIGGAVVLFGPAPPLAIDASAGRIVSVLPDGKNAPAQQQLIGSDSANAHLIASPASRLVQHSLDSAPPAASGGHSAYLTRPTKDSCALVILDGTAVVATYPVPEGCYHVTLSGGLALVSYTSLFIDDTHRDAPGSLLIDLDTGSRTVEPETEALSGDRLAYFSDGDILVKDVSSGVTSTVASDVVPNDPNQDSAEFYQLSLAGDWLMWSVNSPTSAGLTAENLSTNTIVTLPATTILPDVVENDVEAVLADGVAAWIDSSTRAVHLVTLTPGATDTVVGTAHRYADQHEYLSLTDEFAAWVANDDTTRVLPLNAASTAAPAYLGGITPAVFSPIGKGKASGFRPQLDTSRPLTEWTFTISRHGHAVRTLRGTAAIGGVRPHWDGRTSSGKAAPDGIYSWTLSGRGAAGTLQSTDGSSRPITGRIRLDRTAPRPRATHGRVRHRGGQLQVPVRWSCSGGPCRFTVSVAVRSPHTGHWSTATRWLSLTAKTSAVYGSAKVPRRLHPGHTYRFVVVAVDAAGNRSRAVRTTISVPGR